MNAATPMTVMKVDTAVGVVSSNKPGDVVTCGARARSWNASVFGDILICLIVVTYWRGTWNLTDMWWFPDNDLFSAFASLLMAFIGLILVLLVDTVRRRWCCCLDSQPCAALSRMLLLYSYGFVSVQTWRGMWIILDDYVLPEDALVSNLLCHFGGAGALLACSRFYSSLAPPMGALSDDMEVGVLLVARL